jgi:ribosomal protein S18 acetylase RimI-like enzyme
MDEDAPEEADSLGLLLAERVSMGRGHEGFSIFFIQSFPEYQNTGIESALIRDLQAKKKSPLVICSYTQNLLVEPWAP